MIRLLSKPRYGPIGVDIGARSVKMMQLSADRTRLIDAVRWDFPGGAQAAPNHGDQAGRVVEALQLAREGRSFRGRDAVVSLGRDNLFLQNLRVPTGSESAMLRAAEQEASSRLPYDIGEAQWELVPVAEVRQQDAVVQEVLLFACRRDRLREQLDLVEQAGLNPVAVDIEPSALLRTCQHQYRREEDRDQRLLYIHLGYSNTVVVIAEGDRALFVKYVEIGGRHLDEAVAQQLEMDLSEATSLRLHNGDRRSERQDPEISRTIAAAIRPTVERLAGELAMCVRYHSVTFRGKPLSKMVLGGGEANGSLVELLAARLNLKSELGDPLRTFDTPATKGRAGQWDVAAGLALKEVSP